MLTHGNTDYSKVQGCSNARGVSNLDQRTTIGGDKVAEVGEILSYDQTREATEILS
jgi:hypothetical protein